MLLDIKKYLQEKSNANIIELARHCRVTPENMKELLEYWERRGKIKEFFKPNVCGTQCVKCKPEFAKMYEWI